MASIVIIEDELIIAKIIEKHLFKFGHSISGIASSYEEALKLIDRKKPELALIDIGLAGTKSGIDLADHINKNIKIPFIFLSSHSDGLILNEAKQVNPMGFITKPFTKDSLFASIEIVLFNAMYKKNQHTLLIEEGKRMHYFDISEVLFLEADRVYTNVCMSDKKILIRISLTHLIEKFPPNLFIQTHKSYAINILHVQEVIPGMVFIRGNKIPVGRSFKNQVLVALKSPAISSEVFL